MSFGPKPWLQQHWDARAATNIMAGGCGAGLIAFTALAGGPWWTWWLGAAVVCIGLFAVALEIGRPLRSLNVYLHPQRSWMTREALIALVLLAATAAAGFGIAAAAPLAGLVALAYAFSQGRILRAAKGIPAWREPLVVPLIIASGLAEGGGAWLLLAGTGHALAWPLWLAFGLAVAARWLLWRAWRAKLRTSARALAVIDRAGRHVTLGTWLPLAAWALWALVPAGALAAWLLPLLAGLPALAAGLWFKFTLVTRAAFNQGFALPHLPVRGVPHRPPGPAAR